MSSKPESQGLDAVKSIREVAVIVSKLRSGAEDGGFALLFGRLGELLSDQLALHASESSLWKEFVSLTASGRILSAAAEAGASEWFSSGPQYAQWLGRSLRVLLEAKAADSAGQLCHKALMLGYPDDLIEPLLYRNFEHLLLLIGTLPGDDQRKVIYSILSCQGKWLQRNSTSAIDYRNIINTLLSVPATGSYFEAWLTKDLHPSPVALYRTVIAAMAAENVDLLKEVLESSWSSFGDKLAIKHIPIVQQEAVTQVLLLSAGYIHRQAPMHLFTLARSTIHTAAMSTRLASSSPQIRFLGMIVGEAISLLVDSPESRLSFGDDNLNTTESHWYRSLTSEESVEQRQKQVSLVKALTPQRTKAAAPTIVEILGEDQHEKGRFLPYEKLDDPEDDNEDPNLVQRIKLTAPRYVRELAAWLNNNEDYEKHHLALTNAATLIREKAAFGTELKDVCEELASILLGLNDTFHIESFQKLRAAALVSLVIAEPQRMGRWCARSYFSGDYSINQRVLILTTMGIGARELAGFHEDGYECDEAPNVRFPSQMLPGRLHAVYAPDASLLDNIANRLEQTMVQPLALDAADQVTGPSALKVQKISSRLLKEKKPPIWSSANTISDNFFFPLVGSWSLQLPSNFTSPYLLPLYLKTVAVILMTCGHAALSLSRMTTELWVLILSIRAQAQSDQAILEAALFAIITILTVNEDERILAQNHAKQLVETHEWTDQVFDSLDGRDQESARSRSLAASVLLRTKQILESQQRLLLGDLI